MAVGQVVYLLGRLKDNHGGYFFGLSLTHTMEALACATGV